MLRALKIDGLLAFQQPDASITLQDGLLEYYASRMGLVDGRGISDDAREFFRCHDAAHVVFGCSTTLPNEAMVKMWSFFGTTAGLSLLREYRSPESKEIYEALPVRDIVSTAIRSVGIVPRVIARCWRMRRRWPWSEFDGHLQTPLRDLRHDYGIDVLVIP